MHQSGVGKKENAKVTILPTCLMSAEKYSFLNIGTAKGFRGDNEIIGSPNNGSFLGWVELLAEIDPFILEHVKNSKIQEKDKCSTYFRYW